MSRLGRVQLSRTGNRRSGRRRQLPSGVPALPPDFTQRQHTLDELHQQREVVRKHLTSTCKIHKTKNDVRLYRAEETNERRWVHPGYGTINPVT